MDLFYETVLSIFSLQLMNDELHLTISFKLKYE